MPIQELTDYQKPSCTTPKLRKELKSELIQSGLLITGVYLSLMNQEAHVYVRYEYATYNGSSICFNLQIC